MPAMEIIAAIIGLLAPLLLIFLNSMDVVKADKKDIELQEIAAQIGMGEVVTQIQDRRQNHHLQIQILF